jgi:hypothetical protein
MKNSDLYLMDDQVEECACDRCGIHVSDESELFPYYEISVCQDCFDKLNIRDEKERIEFETDGMLEYDD